MSLGPLANSRVPRHDALTRMSEEQIKHRAHTVVCLAPTAPYLNISDRDRTASNHIRLILVLSDSKVLRMKRRRAFAVLHDNILHPGESLCKS